MTICAFGLTRHYVPPSLLLTQKRRYPTEIICPLYCGKTKQYENFPSLILKGTERSGVKRRGESPMLFLALYFLRIAPNERS